jgi:hypothetical protein
MSASHADPYASGPAIDPDAARLERRLATLERRADKFVAMIEAVEKDGAKESVDVVVKLSREIRRTLVLMAKLEQGQGLWAAARSPLRRAPRPVRAPKPPIPTPR